VAAAFHHASAWQAAYLSVAAVVLRTWVLLPWRADLLLWLCCCLPLLPQPCCCPDPVVLTAEQPPGVCWVAVLPRLLGGCSGGALLLLLSFLFVLPSVSSWRSATHPLMRVRMLHACASGCCSSYAKDGIQVAVLLYITACRTLHSQPREFHIQDLQLSNSHLDWQNQVMLTSYCITLLFASI
jgi:hypothetical protein